jgi:hypothetical protein
MVFGMTNAATQLRAIVTAREFVVRCKGSIMDKLSPTASLRPIALLAACAMIAGFSAPAGAKDKKADTPKTAPADKDHSTAEKQYCLVDTFSGSRLPRKTCKTKAEWADEGIDVTQL